MLSPRILHFAKKQVFWDCSTLSACEALPEGLPHTLDTISSTDRHWRGRIQITSSTETDEKAPLVGPNDDSLETFWKAALLNYTSCDLTSQGDKTVAIWSIAKIVRDVLGEEYGGGMWRSALHEQLAWRMKNSGIPNTRIPELQIKNPSWSWASVKGPVVVRGRLCPPRCYTVTDHKGQPDLSFEVEDYGDDRDKEPALIDKPLAMAGFMGEGGIVQGQKAGNYTLESSGGDNDQEEAAPQNVPSGTFEVFLDESLADGYSGLINRCRFIILAATATNADGIYLRYPTTEGTGTEEEVSATYSGTALLLISHKEYAFSQKAKYRSLLKDVCKRRPDVLIPDPPYGQGKSLVDQAIELGKLVQKLRKQEKTDIGGIGFRHRYRRIGTVQFRGLSRKRWESIMEKGKTKILLD